MLPAPTANLGKSEQPGSQYIYNEIVPEEGQANRTLTASGSQKLTFKLPPSVMNLSKSYLKITLTPASVALKKGVYYMNALPFDRIMLKDARGNPIVELNEAHRFFNAVSCYRSSFEDFSDNNYEELATANNYENAPISLSRSLANNVISQRLDGTDSSRSYFEQVYVIPSDGLVETTLPVINLRLDLKLLYHTVCELDRSLYWGDDELTLEFKFGPIGNVFFVATAETDVSTGVAAVASATLSDPLLFLAAENNQEIANAVMGQFRSGGYSILSEYVNINLKNLTGTTQNIQLPINSSYGTKLRRIYHTVYLNSPAVNEIYLRDNTAFAYVTRFATYLDNMRISSNYDLTTANAEDYYALKPKLKNSVISNIDIYNYSWLWCDVFTSEESLSEVGLNKQISSGIDLSGKQSTYQYKSTTPNVSVDHFSVIVTERIITISPTGISMV